MIYVKFTVSTPYVGTENEIVAAYYDETPEKSIDEEFYEEVRYNAEQYEYLVTGWNDEYLEDSDDEDEREATFQNFYEEALECSHWEYITKEEYDDESEA